MMTDETHPIETKPEAKSKWTSMKVVSIERLYKVSVIVITSFLIMMTLLTISQSAVYKIHEYERGLHLRGGKFINVDQPGWHMQIPLVDTVVIVKVNERLGYIERIQAMTSDDVAMDVSLQYTYRVTDPERFALEVDDPERIVFEFVQGKLRDVINTKPMAKVMQSRAAMNQEVTEALIEKETQYGVKFITVQMQSASPPEEVVTAIKDRMVAVQRQEQAQAEATQQRTLADAEFYASQREADAEAYQIAKTTEAQQQALRTLLEELEGKGTLAEQYIQFMIAQELKDNSKWIISGAPALGDVHINGDPAVDDTQTSLLSNQDE
ncbi:MAG: SPFH domain-containing protein [Chloroflexota bacterium]